MEATLLNERRSSEATLLNERRSSVARVAQFQESLHHVHENCRRMGGRLLVVMIKANIAAVEGRALREWCAKARTYAQSQLSHQLTQQLTLN